MAQADTWVRRARDLALVGTILSSLGVAYRSIGAIALIEHNSEQHTAQIRELDTRVDSLLSEFRAYDRELIRLQAAAAENDRRLSRCACR